MSGGKDRIGRAEDYILGLMDDGDRERAERDLERDPEFRETVMRLAAQLRNGETTASPQHLPAASWDAVEASIGAMPHLRATAGGLGPLPQQQASSRRWLGPASLGGWRGALVAGALAAACAVGYVAGGGLADARPVVVAILDREDRTPGAIIEVHADGSVHVMPLADFDVPRGKVMQAWAHGDRDAPPVSLGTMPRPMSMRLEGPHMPLPATAQTYAIMIEDAPGAPDGRPSGPIVAKGAAHRPLGR